MMNVLVRCIIVPEPGVVGCNNRITTVDEQLPGIEVVQSISIAWSAVSVEAYGTMCIGRQTIFGALWLVG